MGIGKSKKSLRPTRQFDHIQSTHLRVDNNSNIDNSYQNTDKISRVSFSPLIAEFLNFYDFFALISLKIDGFWLFVQNCGHRTWCSKYWGEISRAPD